MLARSSPAAEGASFFVGEESCIFAVGASLHDSGTAAIDNTESASPQICGGHPMAKKAMKPVDEVLQGPVAYNPVSLQGPRLTGLPLKLSIWMMESRLFSGMLYSKVLSTNGVKKILEGIEIPDGPMFLPEYPTSIPEEIDVKQLDESSNPALRVMEAAKCIPGQKKGSTYPFKFWNIEDYAEAYRSGKTTPSEVAERFINAVEDSQHRNPPMAYFVSMDKEDLRKQAIASTERFANGNPISMLDGIFIAVKDDIDCLPYPSKGGSVWMDKIRQVKNDSLCVSRLRKCGVIFPGKANMHEIGMGTTGNNPFYGTARNPYNVDCYTGGSSAGSAAIVASGLCPAALGTDVGGSIRIPSSLCGLVGLKSTMGRISCQGGLQLGWSMLCVGPIAANVQDLMLVYAAMLGTHEDDILYSKPTPPCVPLLEKTSLLGNLKLGKYSKWFYDVINPEVSKACDETLELLKNEFGTEIGEVVLPELEELRAAHLITCGSEVMTALNTQYDSVKKHISYDVRGTLALFKNFSANYYVASQCLRRRLMYYHLEALKNVDIIVTPTTPLTAPLIPEDSLSIGESDFVKNGNLMRFIVNGNFLGLPCLSVPVGYDATGLPIGLQLIGRPWQEATLLRVAFAIQELHASSRKRPSVFYDLMC